MKKTWVSSGVLALALLWGGLGPGRGHAQEVELGSGLRRAEISATALFQRYERQDGRVISELSIPLSVFVPIGRRVGVRLRASQAMVTGDGLETLRGISDVRLGLSYAQPLGANSLVLSLGVNLPSGKRALSQEEFQTSIVLRRSHYDFRVPGFGQGLGVAPGATLAIPLSEAIVVGLGAAYQYKGAFEPVSGLGAIYDPGDEVLLTGGLDVRISRTASLSGDVTYRFYGSDALGEEVVYATGDEVAATVQFVSYFGFNTLRILAQYRSRAKSELPAQPDLRAEALRIVPNRGLVRAAYRQRLGERFTLGLLLQNRLVGAAISRDGLAGEPVRRNAVGLVDLGVLPSLSLTRRIELRTRFILTLGDVYGFEAGGGLTLHL